MEVNKQLASTVVKQAAPILRELTPQDRQSNSPSTKTNPLLRATGGFISYRVPIEGDYHDMEGYDDLRVTGIVTRTNIKKGRTPVTVQSNSEIRFDYNKMHRLSHFKFPQILYSADMDITDQGDVLYHGRSVFPSGGGEEDLYSLQKAAVVVQRFTLAAVDMMQEAIGVEVAASADLSEHAVTWKREFPDLDIGPYMSSLVYLPRRKQVYSS